VKIKSLSEDKNSERISLGALVIPLFNPENAVEANFRLEFLL